MEIRLPGHCRAALDGYVATAEETTNDGVAVLDTLSRVRGLELIGLLILPVQIMGARVRLMVHSRPRLLIAPLRALPADDG